MYTKDKVQVSDVRRYILMKGNGEKMKDYYKRRRGWTKRHIDMIDWEGIDGMMREAWPI